MNEKQNQPAELRLITPELGHFVITGLMGELQDQQEQMEGYRTVSNSSLDRYLATGRLSPVRTLGRFSLFK